MRERRRRVRVEARARSSRTADRCRASPRGPARPGGGWSAPCGRRPRGSSAAQPRVERGGVRLGLELGAHLRVLAGDVEVVDDGLQVERRCRPTRRARRPRASMSARAAGGLRAGTRRPCSPPTGRARSSRWCGTSARSAAVGLAVPMSMPRYTCIESTETSSQLGSRRASARASADLPDAVAPTSTAWRPDVTGGRAPWRSRPTAASACSGRRA